MDADTAQTRLLDAAEELFNEHGIQAVGMDTIRSRSGVSLKRLYQLYPAKDRLVEAVLTRRDHTVLTDLRRYVDARTDPRERVLAVFDFLEEWFACSDFRGCTFINTFGELGGISGDVAEIARTHKDAFRRYLRGLVADAGSPPELGDQLAILANGAMATAAISGSPAVARQARDAARVLLDASDRGPGAEG
ncbi:TetR/AcrR family transcriptional regulator [Rhodococcus sp. 2H158]|nr:TetR family transcriptional regulator [Rhodococcus rhodochrous]